MDEGYKHSNRDRREGNGARRSHSYWYESGAYDDEDDEGGEHDMSHASLREKLCQAAGQRVVHDDHGWYVGRPHDPHLSAPAINTNNTNANNDHNHHSNMAQRLRLPRNPCVQDRHDGLGYGPRHPAHHEPNAGEMYANEEWRLLHARDSLHGGGYHGANDPGKRRSTPPGRKTHNRRSYDSDDPGKSQYAQHGRALRHRPWATDEDEDDQGGDGYYYPVSHDHDLVRGGASGVRQRVAVEVTSNEASGADDSDDSRDLRPMPVLRVRRRITPSLRAEDAFELVVETKQPSRRDAGGSNPQRNTAHASSGDHGNRRAPSERWSYEKYEPAYGGYADIRRVDEAAHAWDGGPQLYVQEEHSLFAQARTRAATATAHTRDPARLLLGTEIESGARRTGNTASNTRLSARQQQEYATKPARPRLREKQRDELGSDSDSDSDSSASRQIKSSSDGTRAAGQVHDSKDECLSPGVRSSAAGGTPIAGANAMWGTPILGGNFESTQVMGATFERSPVAGVAGVQQRAQVSGGEVADSAPLPGQWVLKESLPVKRQPESR